MTSRLIPRANERAGFTDKVRLRLLESDADDHDSAIDAIMHRQDQIFGRLNGVLISVTTSVLLLALNLLLK